jgi:hypothetical protein
VIEHWPWWLGGAALASIALAHWFVLGRQMAVSGRFTAIVNRWRFGSPDTSLEHASQAELLAAIQAATQAEFGAALEAPASEAPLPEDTTLAPSEPPEATARAPRRARSLSEHVVFLASLVLGGSISAFLAGSWHWSLKPSGEIFAVLFERTPLSGALVLLAGGILVGAGTRMAAGCTSGHGLCGASRLQPGSLLATVAFFGAAVVTALALKGLS